MTQDMNEMQQQVGPVVELVEEARQSTQAAQVLSRQRECMFLSLVICARTVVGRLGAESPVLPAEGNSDVATYLGFFE